MRYSLLLFTVGAFACGTTGPITGPGTIAVSGETAKLRVVNTVGGVKAIDVLVSGRVVIANLPPGQVSDVTQVNSGTRQVAFRLTGGTAGRGTSLSLVAGDTTTLLTVDSSSVISPWVLTDTGAVVPSGNSSLRVVNFAGNAPSLLAWRTQPNFPTYVTVLFPFPYQTVTPYVQSDPGDWQVLVSTEAYSGGVPVVTDTLALSDPITIPSGESRTVILMDNGLGGVRIVVITP
jgi:hypothetical protein